MSLPAQVHNIFRHTQAFNYRRKNRASLLIIIDITTRKLLLFSFLLNSHTLWFHPQAQLLESPYRIINSIQQSPAQQLSFEWSHFMISPTDSSVENTLFSIINSTQQITSQQLSFEWCVLQAGLHSIITNTTEKYCSRFKSSFRGIFICNLNQHFFCQQTGKP